jgi:guanine deaminase
VPAFTLRATVMQTPSPSELQVLERCRVEVSEDGTIVSMGGDGPVDVELPSSALLLPGLIDTHVHAPQWPQLGTGLDLPLERWLFEYTFPLEARYADAGFAAAVWADMVSTLLAHGTTSAVYYGTVDVDATTSLAATCAAKGQRALVGRVAMDHPEGTPEWYRDADAVAGVAASADSIEAIRELGSALVSPIITPRFIPSCTDELLMGLGELAAETGVTVQTHCSESEWEHRYVLERFGHSDTQMLDRFGLVGRHTVLAHCGHVDDADLALIGGRGAGIAHCPLSNAYFGDGVFPLRRALAAGVAVGLGTDIAGGAHPGMLAQCGQAVTSSRMLEAGVAGGGVEGARIDTVTAFHLATVGGAALTGAPTGLLEPGRPFDAFVVDADAADTALRFWPEFDDHARMFEKVVRLASPPDITGVWVAGRRVR